MTLITEGKISIIAETKKIVDKKMPVFYNPVMIVNRDFSLLVIKALEKKDLIIGDVLAGSGIRTLRILKELEPEIVKKIIVNDIKPSFEKNFKENLKINSLNEEKIIIKSEDANKVMNSEGHFDYIEIDPFGTPNPFLDTSIRALKRNGILSVTATDTSSLCGSYPSACLRKYWAKPLRNELMHEFATRILIRKIQLLGAQHEKALTPLVSYATDHYIKVFFQSINNKTDADKLLKQHQYYEEAGPIFLGPIQNETFIKKMSESTNIMTLSTKTLKLLDTLIEESKIKEPFFYDLHEIASKEKTTTIPRKENMIKKLKEKKYEATKTHFNEHGIKTNANKKEFMKLFKKLI